MQQSQHQREGIAVVGEALRRIPPECAEFLVEITSTGGSAAQSLRDNQARTSQVVQALANLGVKPADLQTISMHASSLYSPMAQGMPQGMPQIAQPGMLPYSANPAMQPETQFGSYHVRNVLRITVRDLNRAGEIVDAAARAGATIGPAFSFQASDEAAARRTALEAAAKDARAKAETIAGATGKQVGDPVAISEDLVVSNGTYAALRSAMPYAFGAGSPRVAGELEYYARVTAIFRIQ